MFKQRKDWDLFGSEHFISRLYKNVNKMVLCMF